MTIEPVEPPLTYVHGCLIKQRAIMRMSKNEQRVQSALTENRLKYSVLSMRQMVDISVNAVVAIETDMYGIAEQHRAAWDIGSGGDSVRAYSALTEAFGNDSELVRRAWELRSRSFKVIDEVRHGFPDYVRFCHQLLDGYAVGLPNLHDKTESPEKLETFFKQWVPLESLLEKGVAADENQPRGGSACTLAQLKHRQDARLMEFTDHTLITTPQQTFLIDAMTKTIWRGVGSRLTIAEVSKDVSAMFSIDLVDTELASQRCLRRLLAFGLLTAA